MSAEQKSKITQNPETTAVEVFDGKLVVNTDASYQLGQGGLGQVHYGIWEHHIPSYLSDGNFAEEVAVKIMKATDEKVLKRALSEFFALLKLNQHPDHQFVEVIDFITEVTETGEWMAFLVLEYLAKPEWNTLESFLLNLPEHRLGFNDILVLAEQFTAAIEKQRIEGVLHRDYKPRNVMINKTGKIKILDFGEALHTETGAAVIPDQAGSPITYSPEHVSHAEGPFTHLADTYSITIVLYMCLTGKMYYDNAPSLNARRLQILHGVNNRTSGLDRTRFMELYDCLLKDGLHEAQADRVCEIFDKALAPEKSARYPSIAGFFFALSQVPHIKPRSAKV